MQCCVCVYKLTNNPIGLHPFAPSREFDSNRLSAAFVLKVNQKRSGNPWAITEKMAASSLSSELLAAIQVPNLRPMPAYLSETDALTVAEFLQTHYAAYYQIDVSNVHWGGETHTSHLFDIFSNFQPQKDSVKTRIEMISFVTPNYRRYSWDCDLYLRMNKLILNDWVEKMTYWGNCGDALAIYAMSDMYGVHSCVVTKS